MLTSHQYSAVAQNDGNIELQDPVIKDEIDEEIIFSLYKESEWQAIGSDSHTFIGALEGLRGLAVLLTCFCHLFGSTSTDLLSNVLGATGVSIFFVLSGFLITGILIRLNRNSKLNSNHSTITVLRQFYMDRFVRLSPSLLFMVVGIYTLHYFTYGYSQDNTRKALLSLTYTSNIQSFWKNEADEGIFFNTWSLAVEEQYYIVWSLIVPIILRLSSRNKSIALTAMLSGTFLLFILASAYKTFIFNSYISLPTNVYKMLIGSYLRLIPLPPFIRKPASTFTGLFGITAMLLIVWQPHHISYYDLFQSSKAGILTLTDPFTAIMTSLIICGLHGPSPKNIILDNQILRFFGKVSYPLYLFQLPLLSYAGWPHGFFGLTVTSMALTLAQFSTFIIEDPIRKRYSEWKRR